MIREKKLYLIAITLPDDLNGKILLIKQEIARDFHSKHSLRLPAHITLQKPFHYKDESFLIKSLRTFRTSLPRFELKLNGFGAFTPKVIYVALEENNNLKDLYRQLQKWFISKAGFEHQELSNKPFVPHITVAYRDLTRQNFAAAWKRYKDKEFKAGFIVSTIDLWRHNGKHWEIIHKFSPYDM
ncbi:MAG: hypothetical protein F6K42_32080 [Leptolyngbya sp. SIO1D8]|nr:hypothetical protein [Leptolyngbya sp. SIO1D8]